MSYSIFYEEYALQFESNDENIIKNAFQTIFELLVAGKSMMRSKRDIFTHIVGTHVCSKSQKVRKWAYHCACFYQDMSVCQLIKTQLETESNIENIIWALTALSVTYDDIVKLRQCVGQRHEEFIETISPSYLTDALVLFGGVVKINPKTILSTNNSADLAALTKIYAYRDLVRDKYPTVTESIIKELEKHDDPYVREYAYWSQVLGGVERNYLNSPNDPNVEVRKWQIGLQIKNKDEDFVVSALKPLALCPQQIPFEIKSGILRGLNEIPYNIKYVQYINSWFERETDDSIVLLLIDYIIANCYINQEDGTYFDVLKDSLDSPPLAKHIVNKIKSNSQYELNVIKKGTRYTLDLKQKEIRVMEKSINVIGSGNSLAISNDHSSATVTSSYQEVNGLEKLIQNVENEAKDGLSAEDRQKVDEILTFIREETKQDTPKTQIIKVVLNSLKAIKGTTQFIAAVAALIDFFK